MVFSNKIFISSIFSIMLVASVFAITSDPVFSNSDDNSDISEITDDIRASDIVESEDEIESSNSGYSRRTISSGSGWITNQDKGALASIHLVNGYIDSEEIISKGWMKFGKLKLKLESTSVTETKKTFDVDAGDGSVLGTLVLTRGSTYQQGFAIWGGDLDIKVRDISYDAKVNLAIEERSLGNDKIKDQRDRSYISISGGLDLGQISFDLKGKAEPNIKKIELDVFGNNNLEGELILEKVSPTEYVGKLKIEELGDEDDKLVGKLKISFKLENNTLYGPVSFVNEDGSELNGNIKLALSRDVTDDSEDDSIDSEKSSGKDEKEDRSKNSSSGSSNRGFWKRFIDFFGA